MRHVLRVVLRVYQTFLTPSFEGWTSPHGKGDFMLTVSERMSHGRDESLPCRLRRIDCADFRT